MSDGMVQVEPSSLEKRHSELAARFTIVERNWLACSRGARQANIALQRHARTLKMLRQFCRRWVPVEKHLPTDKKEKIVSYTLGGTIRDQAFATYSGGQWVARGNRLLEGVTHWQEKPEWPT